MINYNIKYFLLYNPLESTGMVEKCGTQNGSQFISKEHMEASGISLSIYFLGFLNLYPSIS